MIVTERFSLHPLTRRWLYSQKPNFGFGLLGAVVYARTYSRLKSDGTQESWADTVARVVEGCLSIRKWWYVTNRLPWDEERWQEIAWRMVRAIFEMRFLPGGRGLWSMGSPYVYERGSLSLYNCQMWEIRSLSSHLALMMDSLMCGVGTAFSAEETRYTLYRPMEPADVYVIPDSREGWVESLRRLIASYEAPGRQRVEFDYREIRPAGTPIRGFGGVASGAEPLIKLHERVSQFLDQAVETRVSPTRLVADIGNAIGAAVVAGNVRRSAELFLGSIHDEVFLDLKNYERFPERMPWGWMSNNSVRLREVEDFTKLPQLAERIRTNGEPGVFNLLNVQKYARYAEEKPDTATGTNPCAEATLEHAETCNLCEIFPTRCRTEAEFFDAAELATLYASTVALLPTHQEETNLVVSRNRRIGISISGIADWFDSEGATRIVTLMRRAYRVVEETNRWAAHQAGVPESIRRTLIKPSGTVSQLAGVSPGMHYPPYQRYIRRVRVGEGTPIVPLLIEAGVPYERDLYSDRTLVFEFPVEAKARRSQRDLSLWQKAAMVILLQRHWADQMVSNTITFDPKTEGHQIEDFLAYTVPLTKSLSLLPDTDEGAYSQMPYEPISRAEYERRVREIRPIDWSKFGGSDGQDSRFCSNESCDL